MPDDNPQAQQYLHTARKIRKASGVGEIASALVTGVAQDVPTTTGEWRRRAIVRRAVETTLRCLQISIMQLSAASPEMASDQRIDTRRHLVRLLSELAEDHDFAPLAELAVTAVTPETAAESMVKAAQEVRTGEVKAPLAVCCLSGRMLVSKPAHELAVSRGISEKQLESLLTEAAAPVRRACETPHACQIGELRFTKLVPQHDLAIIAHLDGTAKGTPIIRLVLCDAAAAGASQPPITTRMPEEAYPARLLRRLVS